MCTGFTIDVIWVITKVCYITSVTLSWFAGDTAHFCVQWKHEVAYKATCKSRREDITLAVANATSCILDPVIIFTGKIFKVHGRDHALTNMFYTVSESG